jgi:hypothetical protein
LGQANAGFGKDEVTFEVNAGRKRDIFGATPRPIGFLPGNPFTTEHDSANQIRLPTQSAK